MANQATIGKLKRTKTGYTTKNRKYVKNPANKATVGVVATKKHRFDDALQSDQSAPLRSMEGKVTQRF